MECDTMLVSILVKFITIIFIIFCADRFASNVLFWEQLRKF